MAQFIFLCSFAVAPQDAGAQFVEEFDFDLEHRLSYRHGSADSLRGKPVTADDA